MYFSDHLATLVRDSTVYNQIQFVWGVYRVVIEDSVVPAVFVDYEEMRANCFSAKWASATWVQIVICSWCGGTGGVGICCQ